MLFLLTVAIALLFLRNPFTAYIVPCKSCDNWNTWSWKTSRKGSADRDRWHRFLIIITKVVILNYQPKIHFFTELAPNSVYTRQCPNTPQVPKPTLGKILKKWPVSLGRNSICRLETPLKVPSLKILLLCKIWQSLYTGRLFYMSCLVKNNLAICILKIC